MPDPLFWNEIDDGEDEDPDEIDEVPKETNDLEFVVIEPTVIGGAVPFENTPPGAAEQKNTCQHVHSVKAGDAVKCGCVVRLTEDETFLDQAGMVPRDQEIKGSEIFLGLSAKKEHSTNDGCP